MKLEVTRDVVEDLWPLCQSGDASADSQELVRAFLADDEAFQTRLEEVEMLTEAMPRIQLSADAELRLLEEARIRARHKLWIQGGAIAMVGFILLIAFAGALLVTLRSL